MPNGVKETNTIVSIVERPIVETPVENLCGRKICPDIDAQ
jgi:hypothetical protein